MERLAGAVLVASIATWATLAGSHPGCLARCRSPLSFALMASGPRGPLRDLHVGALHGAWCLGCCWQLMLALIAVGTMDLRWMSAIAALILIERVWAKPGPLVRAAGFALVVAGAVAPWAPAVALGLRGAGMS